jgi:hypothetical protein
VGVGVGVVVGGNSGGGGARDRHAEMKTRLDERCTEINDRDT